MASDVDGDTFERAIVTALRENTVKTEGIADSIDRKLDQAYERTAQLLRSYREDTSRSITSIYVRLVSIEDTIETERGTRVARQETLDHRLRRIENWVRAAVVAGLIVFGIMIGWLAL